MRDLDQDIIKELNINGDTSSIRKLINKVDINIRTLGYSESTNLLALGNNFGQPILLDLNSDSSYKFPQFKDRKKGLSINDPLAISVDGRYAFGYDSRTGNYYVWDLKSQKLIYSEINII